ncbi:MAG: hypothetical protein A2785_04020 [Candidatus Chisholmbacteria bacterium RIFCSPHIGHO2_01_FULL_49_18]|uniref:ABC-2 type transporter domain-containing protein n=2 Tax=Candidatus Chisholmiibacteriota TaxID=1817900 RepID=A0A1G1VPK0_9BACT|nr:MAG: hypothetical protein A2785_04020 [Candidatus Chisholmbacteria bacterium RIFCSPHIGHO2_01_FULL_49_18]OGY20848.1 MAG: hypothetical protein A3A65_05075 [Candidatus Chisholmbacteria bacterium RIFCSPLOWO2_01_FULL_49_14]
MRISSFKKYFQVAKTSWSGGFVYRLNFVMWRVRNVVQLIAIYFLWFAVMSRNPTAFNYSTSQMLTYILGTSIIRALVFGQRSIDAQGEISSGDLNNYLVKPISYFRYWFSRDIADKLLNILFSIGEITILLFWLRPEIYLQTNPLMLVSFLLASLLAMVMYFYFSFLISMTTFWIPEENGWPQRFFIFVILEFFSGGLFPLDILPPAVYAVLGKLPSAYFLNTPLQIYLGRLDLSQIVTSLFMMAFWIVVLRLLANRTFRKGLKIYGAYGR